MILPAVVDTPGPDDLLSGREIAELLGWADPGTAWKSAQNGTFPQPVRTVRPRLWRRGDVEEWARTRPRRPTRRKRPGQL